MNPQGIDPYAFLQNVATRLDRARDRQQLAEMLDGVEYLYEVLDPEQQDLAEGLMQRLRARIASLSA